MAFLLLLADEIRQNNASSASQKAFLHSPSPQNLGTGSENQNKNCTQMRS